MDEKRIKLAEAIGYERRCGGWLKPNQKKRTYVPQHKLPDPFTDANADVDVLEWAKENLDDKEYADAMFEVVLEQGADINSSFPVYVKGNYARATCKVLRIK